MNESGQPVAAVLVVAATEERSKDEMLYTIGNIPPWYTSLALGFQV